MLSNVLHRNTLFHLSELLGKELSKWTQEIHEFVVVEDHVGATRLSQPILPFNFSLIPYNFIHDYNNLFIIFINLQGVEFIKNNNPC